MWTATTTLQALYIAVAVMLMVVLYHILFIVVDLRKILRRIETITQELEAVVIKPLALADKAMEWVVGYLEAKQEKEQHHHKRHE